MDTIDSHYSLTTNNANFVATVTKETTTVPGKVDNALRLNVGQTVKVNTIKSAGGTCLTNLQACKLGLYISMWIKFKETSSSVRYLYMNKDVEIFYENDANISNTGYLRSRRSLKQPTAFAKISTKSKRDVVAKANRLYASFNLKGKKWSSSVSSLPLDTWIFLEISWNPKSTLKIFIDKNFIDESRQVISSVKSREKKSMKYLCMGCQRVSKHSSTLNQHDYSYKSEDSKLFMDEVELWFQDKDSLHEFNRITRDNNVIHVVVLFNESSLPSVSSPNSSHSYQIDNNLFIHPKLHGDVRISDKGMRTHKVLSFSSRGYADLGSYSNICFGNVSFCKHGFTISALFRQKAQLYDGYVISAPNYFVKLPKTGNNMVVGVKYLEKVWFAESARDSISVNKLNKVDVSWSEDRGLAIFINKILKAKDLMGSTARTFGKISLFTRLNNIHSVSDTNVYIGSPPSLHKNKEINVEASLLIEQLEFWFASRNLIIGFNSMDDDVAGFRLDMERMDKDMIFHQSHTASVHNSPKLVPGFRGNGLLLNGLNQYLDLGRDVICKSDLDNCLKGITVKFKVKPMLLMDLTYFVASPLVEVFYEDDLLICLVRNKTKQWTLKSPRFKTGRWNRVEISWHPLKGAFLNINSERVDNDSNPTTNEFDYQRSKRYLIGHADTSMKYEYYANAVFDDVEFWEGDSESLEKVGKFVGIMDEIDVPKYHDSGKMKTTLELSNNASQPFSYQAHHLQHPHSLTSFRPDQHQNLNQHRHQQQVYKPFHRRMLTFDGFSYILYQLNFKNMLDLYRTQNDDLIVSPDSKNENGEGKYEEFRLKIRSIDPNGLIFFSGSTHNNVYLCVKVKPRMVIGGDEEISCKVEGCCAFKMHD